jgi:catechol 2,3-dioxygenase-like lactoylglutathione lyase family enzyme
MLSLGSTYLIVKDMQKSIKFYEALLEMKVSAQRYNRWAQFNFDGNCIALLNVKYDEELIKHGDNLELHYSSEYLKYIKNRQIQYGNNFVLNFYIENLNMEYERIKKLNIGKVTKLMYINISSPYHFFLLEDPDGNTIEITGNYSQE